MKLAVGLLALMLAIAGVSFWAFWASPAAAPCTDRDVSASLAPDGKALAEVFTRQCDASLATHVSLRAAGSNPLMRSDVFIAAGAPNVQLQWNGPNEVVVKSPAERVLVEESNWRSVRVQFRRGR